MSRFRWSNVPVPEGHVILLLAGLALHRWRPLRLTRAPGRERILGGLFLGSGVALASWAVASAGEQEIHLPEKLVTIGPYAYSRNPMYLAWHLISISVAIFWNTAWLALLLPGLLLYTHRFVILREEGWLEEQFGQAYLEYCDRVRRYF